MNNRPCASHVNWQHAAGLAASLLLLSCGGNPPKPPVSTNHPPVIANAAFDNGGAPFNSPKVLDLMALTHAADADGDAITFRMNRTVSGSEIGSLAISDRSATFTPLPGVEGQAVFEIAATDTKGAPSAAAQLTVSRVDTLPPPLSLPMLTPSSATTGSVTAEIRSSEREDIPAPSGWTRLGASGDWTYQKRYTTNVLEDLFSLRDQAGNAATQRITINNILVQGPVVEDPTYVPATPTREDVVVTFRSQEALNAPAGWTRGLEAGTSLNTYMRTFSANTNTTATFTNAQDQRTDKAVVITWIDREAPQSGGFQASQIQATSVTVSLTATDAQSALKAYLLALPTQPATDPTVQHIVDGGAPHPFTSGQTASITRSGLTPSTPSSAYLVLEDSLGNRSASPLKLTFTTAATEPSTCTVTFAAGAGGTLSGTTSQTVANGASCTAVTAIPNAGYVFTNWTGTGFTPSTANPLTLTNVTASLALTANFTAAPVQHTVTFAAGAGGTLSGTTSQTVANGASCTAVTAIPNAGYVFTNWTGTGFTPSTANPLTLTNVTASLALTANFTAATGGGQIIADHTVVDRFSDIPQRYIDQVKTMLVSIAGESHAEAYRVGLQRFAQSDARFPASVFYSFMGTEPPAASTSSPALRLGTFARNDNNNGWTFAIGESIYFARGETSTNIQNTIDYCNAHGRPLAVIGFGWCWDMVQGEGPGGTLDPVHRVHWAGRTDGGPQGSHRWGLDATDQALTGNSVCMDTYLQAVERYRAYCAAHGHATVPIFTTGPVDPVAYAGTENGMQREIKHEHIRAFVKQDASRVLFDYADILCHNNAGVKYTATWNDGGTLRPHANIHPDCLGDASIGHIGEVGAIRLAKAMWWMLARIAGWDGVTR